VEEPERRSFEPPELFSGIDSSALATGLQRKAEKYRSEIPNVARGGTKDGTLSRRPALEAGIDFFELFGWLDRANIRDAGESGSAPGPRNSGIDAFRRSLKHGFDASVSAIADPAREAMP
jgi:hypothetical protein